MGAVVSSVSIAVILLKNRIVGVNQKIAKATFFIFLSHIFVLGPVGWISNRLFVSTDYLLQTIVYIARPIVTAIVCLLIFELMNKFTPRFLSLLVGSRK